MVAEPAAGRGDPTVCGTQAFEATLEQVAALVDATGLIIDFLTAKIVLGV